jgi:hypothetical protein
MDSKPSMEEERELVEQQENAVLPKNGEEDGK